MVRVVPAEHEKAVAAAATLAAAVVKATSTVPWTKTGPLTTAPAMTRAEAWHKGWVTQVGRAAMTSARIPVSACQQRASVLRAVVAEEKGGLMQQVGEAQAP